MGWIYNQIKHTTCFPSIVLTDMMDSTNKMPSNHVCSNHVYPISTKQKLILLKLFRKIGIRIHPLTYDQVFKKHRPKLLHSHFGDRGWYDIPLARKYNLKHIVTFYGYDVKMLPSKQRIWRKRYKDLFNHVDLVLCEGPHMAKEIIHLGCNPEKVQVQHLGVEVDTIPFQPRQINPQEPIRILIAGSFREKKGIPYALEAIARVRLTFPNLVVTIIGDSSGHRREEEEKRKIAEVIRRHNLTPIIRWLGFQPHDVLMKEAYKHHIFLSPSITATNGDTEGGAPVTIIEMSATGMPIVSTRHCDIPEVVQHGATGLLAEERDVEGLAHHLLWLMRHCEIWPKMGEAGRRHVQAQFDAKVLGANLSRIYAEQIELHEF